MKARRFAASLGLSLIVGVSGSAVCQTSASAAAAAPADAVALRADSMLPASDLQADVAILRHAYEALHPGLYRYNTAAQMDLAFDALVRGGASDLVIDLRGNEGGLDVGDEIVSHLITQDVARQLVTRRVRYRKVPDALVPYLDTWDPSFRDWGASALDSTGGFYRLRRDADDDPGSVIRPAPPRFAGRAWVLVGATNSSATFEFAQIVKQNRLPKLVGQPAGGNQRGINGGAFFFLRLPHSRIELDLPLTGQFPDGGRPDAGLQPDILVNPTVSDIAQGRDAELNAVRAQIRRPPARTGSH